MAIDQLDDRALMKSLKEGDAESFAELHSRHRKNVIRLLMRITRDASAAEELAQDVFLRVYQARARYQPTASFSTWLYRITFNRGLNYVRSKNVRRIISSFDAQPGHLRTLYDAGPDPESLLLNQERIHRIREAVLSLPDRQRAALMLHKYDGLDYVQIAECLNTTVPAIKSLLFRTYVLLQQRLKNLP